MNRCARIQRLFEGKGKPLAGRGGRQLDTTSSGYDYSVVLALAKAGIDDPEELATVLWCRPDDAARSKGESYIHRTIERAQAQAKAERDSRSKHQRDTDEGFDFTVDRVIMFQCDPPKYELGIEGKVLTLRNTGQLLSPTSFRNRFVDVLGRVPSMPSNRAMWRKWVDDLLARAEKEEMPEEASGDGELRQQIAYIIGGLIVGENASDLDLGKCLIVNGERTFKSQTIFQGVREAGLKPKPADTCVQLRKLGYSSGTDRVGDDVVRAWRRRGADPAPATEEPQD